MCSAELLLWKNQKVSTRYPTTLYKWNSTFDIFLWIFNIKYKILNISDKLFHKTAPNHRLKRVFICLECQIIIVLVGLRMGIYRSVKEKYCNCFESRFWRSKRSKSICVLVFWKKSKKFLSPFIVKLQTAIAYKKTQSKDYSVNSVKKETLTQRLLHKYFL